MNLTPPSSIVIDLMLLIDAIDGMNRAEARHLARRIRETASANQLPEIARHAQRVEQIARRPESKDRDLGSAALTLLRESEDRLDARARAQAAERRRC